MDFRHVLQYQSHHNGQYVNFPPAMAQYSIQHHQTGESQASRVLEIQKTSMSQLRGRITPVIYFRGGGIYIMCLNRLS